MRSSVISRFRSSDRSPIMQTFGIGSAGHNIPGWLRHGSSHMCAVRVRNTRDHAVYFQSHASFYGTAVPDMRHHISLHVNGVFAKPLLVPDDCLDPGQCVTLYVPFHADEPGAYRLQFMIAEQDADPVTRTGAPLLEAEIEVGDENDSLDFAGRTWRACST